MIASDRPVAKTSLPNNGADPTSEPHLAASDVLDNTSSRRGQTANQEGESEPTYSDPTSGVNQSNTEKTGSGLILQQRQSYSQQMNYTAGQMQAAPGKSEESGYDSVGKPADQTETPFSNYVDQQPKGSISETNV